MSDELDECVASAVRMSGLASVYRSSKHAAAGLSGDQIGATRAIVGEEGFYSEGAGLVRHPARYVRTLATTDGVEETEREMGDG